MVQIGGDDPEHDEHRTNWRACVEAVGGEGGNVRVKFCPHLVGKEMAKPSIDRARLQSRVFSITIWITHHSFWVVN